MVGSGANGSASKSTNIVCPSRIELFDKRQLCRIPVWHSNANINSICPRTIPHVVVKTKIGLRFYILGEVKTKNIFCVAGFCIGASQQTSNIPRKVYILAQIKRIYRL